MRPHGAWFSDQMTNSCPSCGSTVEFARSTREVLRGDCSACGHAFTILESEGPTVEIGAPSGPEVSRDVDRANPGEASEVVLGPKCADCGTSLTFEPSGGAELIGKCPDCESNYTFSLATQPSFERNERWRPREERSFGPRRQGPPQARPCRQCGAPLSFSTGPDGSVVGQCAACGNRFSLPPRRDDRFRPGGRGPPRGRPEGRYGFAASRFRNDRSDGGRPPWTRAKSGYRARPPETDATPDARVMRRRRPRRE